MCLIITQLEPKIADKDIVCYKLVRRTKIKGIYKSEILWFEYIIRQAYINNINIKFVNKLIQHWPLSNKSVIEVGMFHSYVYPIPIKLAPHMVQLKCIIPKGAYYFKGNQCISLGYASSQIKILEEI